MSLSPHMRFSNSSIGWLLRLSTSEAFSCPTIFPRSVASVAVLSSFAPLRFHTGPPAHPDSRSPRGSETTLKLPIPPPSNLSIIIGLIPTRSTRQAICNGLQINISTQSSNLVSAGPFSSITWHHPTQYRTKMKYPSTIRTDEP